jgi:hypothetical protein
VNLKERKDRVDNALHATRAAVEEGVVPGGGTALFYASRASRYAFLQSRRLNAAGTKERSLGTTPITDHASRQAGNSRPLRKAATDAPHCSEWVAPASTINLLK